MRFLRHNIDEFEVPFLKFFNILNKTLMNFPSFLIFINKDKINEYLYTER